MTDLLSDWLRAAGTAEALAVFVLGTLFAMLGAMLLRRQSVFLPTALLLLPVGISIAFVAQAAFIFSLSVHDLPGDAQVSHVFLAQASVAWAVLFGLISVPAIHRLPKSLFLRRLRDPVWAALSILALVCLDFAVIYAARLLLVAVVAAALAPTREFENVDAHWQIMWENSKIPEAGGHHPFLWRNSKVVHVIVDRDTYEYKAVGDDCMVWIGLDSRGLYIACGDHKPLLMSPAEYAGNIKVDGDTVSISAYQKPYFAGSLREWKPRALQQPDLTNSWQADKLHAGGSTWQEPQWPPAGTRTDLRGGRMTDDRGFIRGQRHVFLRALRVSA